MSYLKSLSKEVNEMWTLVLSQHQKSLTALSTFDKDLAREIILIEERVNSCGQFIESDCEHYFSLRGFENLNIPYAMFALKISRELEIIGDLAKKIASEILEANSTFERELVQKMNIEEPFRTSNKILELLLTAFEELDLSYTQVALGRIKISSEMIASSRELLSDYLVGKTGDVHQALHLFSVLESLCKTVEASQNICNRIINYNKASVLLD